MLLLYYAILNSDYVQYTQLINLIILTILLISANLCPFGSALVKFWQRTHIKLQIRRRLLPISFAIARFLDSPGGGTTSTPRYTIDCNHRASHPVLVLWAVLAEDTHQSPIRRRFLPIAFAYGSPLGKSWRRTHIKKHAPFGACFCVCPSFKLHRSRWLRGQIVEHSIHVIHLIYYSIHHLLQH